MKKKLEELLKLHNELPADFEIEIIAENEKRVDFVEMAGNIAPQAANKLMEAAELLERAKEEIQNIYGRDNDLTMEIFRFLEDFNND
jgi:hypothetical protein